MPGHYENMSIEKKCIAPYMFNLLVRVFDEKNLDSQTLLRGLDYQLSDLANQNTRMSYQDAVTIIRNAYQISKDEALGLTIAKEVNLSDWGMMGYAVMSCNNLWDSLVIGQRYNRTATQLTYNEVEKKERFFSFQSKPIYAVGEEERFLVEEDIGGVVGMLHRYLGDDVSPLEVHFSYSAPSYRDRYDEHFRCPVRFRQTKNQIVWNIADIKRPLPLRNPAAMKLAIEQCEKFLADDGENLNGIVEQVHGLLTQTPGEYPSITKIASSLNRSESSLRRSLKAAGTSYQTILNNVRKKLAIEYLTTSSLKLEDIAYLLGYGDLSNFRRAFRSWTGKAPLEYRKSASLKR